ncbi:MAG: putative polysaccharide biosynthesis protein with aminopeptidase-like domain protein [Chloroflexi bacterium]|nr:putative polysaccharide biosynthesis protein with aminopeptidase-like domain protein [Chloroflexota bacterium]
MSKKNLGEDIYAFAEKLFPIHRSITGDGVRKTLGIIQEEIPQLTLHEVPSGTQAFDWTVPSEWNIRDAYILDPHGEKIVDFQDSNLHVVGYSTPVDQVLPLEELQKHLYSLPEQPGAIPYLTSYYKKRWGFCLKHNQRQKLEPGGYRVFIDSEFKEDGSLTYGEIILPGEVEKEIFLSTYICHPSMANNEISGPAVTTFLANWLRSQKRKYTYRIIFIPETIGAIVYLSRNLKEMRSRVVAGFLATCVGDDRAYSYLSSRAENTLADRVALHVLRHLHPEFKKYTYLDRQSDERQYCSPGVDLPVASVMRSKYGTYPEYHTSLDNLALISPAGLQGGYEVLQKCIECLEANEKLKVTVLCEPQLGKRGLYPSLSTKNSTEKVRDIRNLIAYADGTQTLLEIAEKIQVPMWKLIPIAESLKEEGLLEAVK